MKGKAVKTRDSRWDNIKAVLILLVVLGHIADLYMSESRMFTAMRTFIYAFHMPLFIFLSGLFSKRAVDEKKWNRVGGYLIMYFFVSFLGFFANMIMWRVKTLDLFVVSKLPWYMLAMAIMLTVTILIQNVCPVYVLICSVVLSCFIGYATENGKILCYMRAVNFYPFFYIGYIIDRKKLETWLDRMLIRVASIFYLMVRLFACVKYTTFYARFGVLLTAQHEYEKLDDLAIFGGLLRLVTLMDAVLLGCAFMSIVSLLKRKTFLTVLGERTLAIYSVHYILLNIVFNYLPTKVMLQKQFPMGWKAAVLLLGVVIAYVCAMPWIEKICRKVMSPPTRKRNPVGTFMYK